MYAFIIGGTSLPPSIERQGRAGIYQWLGSLSRAAPTWNVLDSLATTDDGLLCCNTSALFIMAFF